MKKLRLLAVLTAFLNLSCKSNPNEIRRIPLPEIIEESSGLASFGADFLSHNDSGGAPVLYQLNPQGEVVNQHHITGAVNRDWEDLAQDENQYYIADTGNNKGTRNDLTIYITDKNLLLQDSIKIQYQKQKKFKKNKKTKYDAEALMVVGDSLVLFSKNRKSMNTQLYTFPKTAGTYTLSSRKKYKINTLITGGDYDPQTKVLVLTGYRPDYSQYLLKANDFELEQIETTEFERFLIPMENAQIEAVKILENQQIWISSESEGYQIPFLSEIKISDLEKLN